MVKVRTFLAVPIAGLAVATLFLDNQDPLEGSAALAEIAVLSPNSKTSVDGKASADGIVNSLVSRTLDAPRVSPDIPAVPKSETVLARLTPPKNFEKRSSVSVVVKAAPRSESAVKAAAPVIAVPTGPITMARARDAIRERKFSDAASMLSSDDLASEADAMYLLATLFRKGEGVARDNARAFALMHKAAENGHLDAEFSLARMYISGRGVAADRGQAQIWMARAAEGGHVGATEALVVLMMQAMALPQANEEVATETPQIAVSDIAGRQGKSPMIEAAERGEVRTLKRLLSANETPELRDADGRTPLMLAAAGGHDEAVQLLLDHGAQTMVTDNNGRTALMHAATAGRKSVVGSIGAPDGSLALRDNDGQSASDLAFASGKCSLGTALFVGSASSAVQAAILETCGAEEMQTLKEKELVFAAMDDRGRSPVWYAARAGNAEVVSFLIEEGFETDAAGLSPLLIAINGAHENVASILIAAGADIDTETSSGNTALMIAATRGLSSVVERLVQKGAKLDHRNRDGYSALMLAAEYGRSDLAKLLIRHGADTGLRNVKRERAADIAKAAGYLEIAALLN